MTLNLKRQGEVTRSELDQNEKRDPAGTVAGSQTTAAERGAMMTPEGVLPMSQRPRLAVAEDNDRLPLTVWIEQYQEFHGLRAVAPDVAQDWDDVILPYPPAAVVREDVAELGQRLTQLAEWIQAPEQR
jgi:hypothetical protein